MAAQPESGKSEYPTIKLNYWKLQNRGNWAKLILELSDIPYENVMDTKVVIGKIRAMGTATGAKPVKVMAPPFIEVWNAGSEEGSEPDLLLSQSPVICRYLASLSKVEGMYPSSFNDQLIADVAFQNINDAFVDMYPQKWMDKDPESDDNAGKYMFQESGRHFKWMGIFMGYLDGDKPYFFGDQVSYCDLALFNLIVGLIEFFDNIQPGLYKSAVLSKFPKIESLFNSILALPKVQKLHKEQAEAGLKWMPYHIFNEGFMAKCKAALQPYLDSLTAEQFGDLSV